MLWLDKSDKKSSRFLFDRQVIVVVVVEIVVMYLLGRLLLHYLHSTRRNSSQICGEFLRSLIHTKASFIFSSADQLNHITHRQSLELLLLLLFHSSAVVVCQTVINFLIFLVVVDFGMIQSVRWHLLTVDCWLLVDRVDTKRINDHQSLWHKRSKEQQ